MNKRLNKRLKTETVAIGIVLGAMIGLHAATTNARADAVWLVDRSEPIFGMVVEQNDQSLRLNQTSDGINFVEVELKRAEVQSVVLNFDAARLERLSPDRLADYYNYAEELLPQAKDPVARRLAIRLFVIVAGNSKQDRVRSAAIASLVRLANSKTERARWRMLQYLETGSPNLNAAQSQDRSGSIKQLATEEQRRGLVQLLQSLRRGETVNLNAVDPIVRKTAALWSELCPWEELQQISKSNRIGDEQLQRLVEFEYAVRQLDQQPTVGSNEDRDSPVAASWQQLASRIEIDRVKIPSIGNATEFDPRESVFRDGRWQTP